MVKTYGDRFFKWKSFLPAEKRGHSLCVNQLKEAKTIQIVVGSNRRTMTTVITPAMAREVAGYLLELALDIENSGEVVSLPNKET
jgi:hypothetical protein